MLKGDYTRPRGPNHDISTLPRGVREAILLNRGRFSYNQTAEIEYNTLGKG